MYAIFQSGGKQYQAQPGAVLRLEKLPGEVGERVTLDQVLMVADGEDIRVGQPVLQDAAITGRIVEQARHRKIVVLKYKRRKDYRKKQGHRQYYTAVLIESIGGAPEEAQAPAPEAQAAE